MPIVLRIPVQILVILLASVVLTKSTNLINQPSDISVLFGVVGILVAITILWYGTKFVWRNFTKTTTSKGDK